MKTQAAPVATTERLKDLARRLRAHSVRMMQSGKALRWGPGELFFLDMVQPVPIGELAEDVIRLWGLRLPDQVAVEVVGLRPGELLTEEPVIQEESLEPRDHGLIRQVGNDGLEPEQFVRDVKVLRELAACRDHAGALEQLRSMKFVYRTSNEEVR